MMRKRNRAALLIAAGLWGWTGGCVWAADPLYGSEQNNFTVTINTGEEWSYVYGKHGDASTQTVSGGHIIMNGGTAIDLYGGDC